MGVRPYLAFTGFTTDGQDYTLQTACARMWEIPGYYALKRERGKLSHGPAKRYDAGTLAESPVRQEYADSNQVKVNDDGKFIMMWLEPVAFIRLG